MQESYNGYKVYWEDGAQISPAIADKVIEYINNSDYFTVESADENSPYLNIIGAEVDKGFENVIVVKEQEMPDGNFPTVASPNPENKECFDIAIKIAKEQGADLIVGTDPDSDRVGIVVKNTLGEYVTMTGNQVGAMLVHYILTAKKERGALPENGAIVSTIVSTKMGKTIADKFGIKFFKTLTGFKFIGEKMYEFERDNSYEFLLGYEESYGYLSGTYARDKDAVVATMLICEMAAYYAEKGMTLYDVMEELYKIYGGFSEELVSITLTGSDGMEKINKIMESFRNNTPSKIGCFDLLAVRDYKKSIRNTIGGESEKLDLPKSDVLYFKMSDGIDFIIRPSGTEPKIKIYFLSSAEDKVNADKKIKLLKSDVIKEIEKI